MAGLPVVLFDGLAYGMLLFLMSIGLSVTLGLMGFVNLAHGVFAAFGGYVAALGMRLLGLPFLAALPAALLAGALAGLLLELALFRRLYRRGPLDQVLFTIGLVYVWTSLSSWAFGPGQQPAELPEFLSGQISVLGLRVGSYRLVLLVAGALMAAGVWLGIERTRFGARIRAAVDDRDMAAGLGIRVDRLFAMTFALGAALGGLGGALSIPILGIDPGFPLKYLAFVLIVVVMGGAGTVTGALAAALLVGVCDVAGKYYLPQIGAFVIYALLVATLLWRPQGIGRLSARARP